MRVMDKPANTDGTPSGGLRRAALFALLLIAFGLRLSDMVIVGNTHHPDEIFQTLEPGHRLWTGMGVVTWEWREGIRSWALPAVIAIIMRLSALVSETPLVYLGGVHAVLALSSLLIVYVAFRMGERVAGFTGAMIAGLLCALWPDLVYYGARSSSEAVATPLLVLVVYLASIHDGSREDGQRRLLWIGVLLGVVFILRFHLALALFVIAAWTCRTDIRGRWLPLIAAAALPVVASGLFDWATLGTPFQSIWKNFWINIIDSRSTSYGTHGRLFFLRGGASELGLAIIPVVVGLIAGARRAPLFVLSAAAVYLTFSAIAHKEMRFVYPATPLLVIAVSVGGAARVGGVAPPFCV
jgi:GPI mannosyltransferase 3